MNQTKLSRPVALAALALVASGLAGCDDRFRSADTSTLKVVRVVAFDNTNATNRPVVVENPGPTATLDAVPAELGALRVDFSRTLDGKTVQVNPGSTLCTPSSNIHVTKTSADPAVDPVDLTGAGATSVCYNPGGTNPNIIITLESSPTCAGPNPNVPANGGPLGIEPGATYVVTATGVKDLNGGSVDFTVTVKGADFIASGTYYQADFGTTSGATTGLAFDTKGNKDLNGSTGVPLGKLDPKTGLYTTPTAVLTSTAYTGNYQLYGTPLTIHFEGGPMCPVGYESLCGAAGSAPLTVADDPGHVVDAAYVGENLNGLENHIVPRLPLESGQTYSFDVQPGIQDVNEILNANADVPGTSAGVTATFTTEDVGANKVVWRWPNEGTTGVYTTLDRTLVRRWTGQPMVGVATAKALAANAAPFTPTGVTLAEKGGTAVPVTLAAGDTRNRSITFNAATDRLSLKNDTDYTMSWTIPGTEGTGAVSFKTLPFGQDPNIPGFAGEMSTFQTASVSYRGTIMNVGGSVYSSLGGKPITYFTTVTGKVAYSTAAAPTLYTVTGRSEFSFFPLTGGDVKLFQGKPSDNVPVTLAQSGYAKAGASTAHPAVDPWDVPSTGAASGTLGYPGSLVGVVPSGILKPGQPYTMVANVTPAAGGAATTITFPFSTAAFRIGTAYEGSLTYSLTGSPQQAVFSATQPLQLRTTAAVDPATFSTTDRADGPVLVVSSDGTPIPVHLATPSSPATELTRGAGQWIRVVPGPGAVKPDTTYTVIVTNQVMSAPAWDGSQTPITPITYTLTTPSDTTNPDDPYAPAVCTATTGTTLPGGG